jgi:hypothetical protein
MAYLQVYWLGEYLNKNPCQEKIIENTPPIQTEINASAKDLFQSMKSVSVLYANQIEALQCEFNRL